MNTNCMPTKHMVLKVADTYAHQAPISNKFYYKAYLVSSAYFFVLVSLLSVPMSYLNISYTAPSSTKETKIKVLTTVVP